MSDEARRESLDAAVAAVWQRMRPTVLARFTGIEEALVAVQAGALTNDLRERAIQEAHKLAGSLGTFGFPHGTDLAREIERAFRDDVDAEAARRFAERLQALKDELQA